MTDDPTEHPTDDFWAGLRGHTPARIGLRRHGEAVSTRTSLELATAHAEARDAVHHRLDVDRVVTGLRGLGWGEPDVVASAAPDRATYLTRPDLGRRPASPLGDAEAPVDLAVVVADGLSAVAVERHAVDLLLALADLLPDATTIAPPTVATQARVALGDHVGAARGARLVLTLIGERPGLSATDSLGAYLTWGPRPGIADSARNCVSNIRPPHGLAHADAARTLAALMEGARRLGATGTRLKDTSRSLG